MVKNPETGALEAFNFDELLSNIPELKLLEHDISTVSFEDPVDSSDMDITDYVKLAELIEINFEDYDGFVVLHGSDTMSYSASVISFMFEKLKKTRYFHRISTSYRGSTHRCKRKFNHQHTVSRS